MKRYIKAATEMSYDDFKKTYSWALKKYPDIANLFGADYEYTLTETNYVKRGGKWVQTDSSTENIPLEYYMNAVDAVPFFKNLGGREQVKTKGVAGPGYIPTEIVSTSPDGQQKTIRSYTIRRGTNASTRTRGKSIMASAWKAPNGKKYGKQTSRFPGKYLFTRKELRDMVDSGIAEDMAGTFDPMAMDYDIIGISWNETNGYRSGILIQDNDTGELYVGNTGDATRARL